MSSWIALGKEREAILRLRTPPVAITFSEQRRDGVAVVDPVPEAMPDGRTGRVPAGCVFWVKATQRTFSTVPEDHGNCSVGQLTHGMATLDDVLGIPTIRTRPGATKVAPGHTRPEAPSTQKEP